MPARVQVKKRKKNPWMRRSKPEDRTEDGIVFPSKAERRYHRQLKADRRRGLVKWWVRQPIFDLAGVQYKPDFLVVYTSGAVSVVEVKSGRPHSESITRWRRNAEQVKTLWGVDVDVVEV